MRLNQWLCQELQTGHGVFITSPLGSSLGTMKHPPQFEHFHAVHFPPSSGSVNLSKVGQYPSPIPLFSLGSQNLQEAQQVADCDGEGSVVCLSVIGRCWLDVRAAPSLGRSRYESQTSLIPTLPPFRRCMATIRQFWRGSSGCVSCVPQRTR